MNVERHTDDTIGVDGRLIMSRQHIVRGQCNGALINALRRQIRHQSELG